AVDVMGQRLHVAYDAAVVSAARISDAVAETGMRAWLEHERPVEPLGSHDGAWPLALAGAAVAAGLALQFTMSDARWAWPVFAVAIAASGRQPLAKALNSLRRRNLDINVLMLLAVIGALALGDWAEGAAVVWLFAASQWLEIRTMERARDAIRGVMTLAPTEAVVKHGGHDHRTPVDRIAPGAVVLVAPGEKIPLDGVVTAGQSDVNQAPITGESLPIDRAPGDEVFAGTINGHGALEVRVTRAVRDTTLARIVHLVETAQADRAPTQQFIDRFARWYTPTVVTAAALVFVVPVLLGLPAGAWAYRALVLLVVACPCALVISTPVSIVAALATAARHGVLIKGGAHLERLAGVRVVAFDKTGTLTVGEPAVVTVTVLNAEDDLEGEREALAAAAAVEARSAHPIARAVVAAARLRGLESGGATDVVGRPGRGADGRWRNQTVVVGNARLMSEQGLADAAMARAGDAMAARGETAVFVAIGGRVRLALGVADRARPVAADVVRLLRGQGIAHVALLTGDTRPAAAVLAAATGVTDVRAGLLPEEKLAVLRELRQTHGPVAMVGDGVNDAPALAAADVGIAMGVIGSAAALEAADIALMSDELQKIPYAVRLGRATLTNVRTNVALSLGLKVAVLVLAVAGLSTLWMAVLADTGASVLVVANAMRLLRHQ
ncbi:MAG TPA: heavy metal translocating P-type ATPase, partial [Vicinamibacterales bacterium]|nr:heavy metal translocating P-type ATPase [Vicinamibacterales bacterium]